MLIFSRLVAKKWEKHNYSKRSCWAGSSVFLSSIVLFEESYEINLNSEIFVNHGSNKYVKIWQPRKKLNGKRADLDTWLRTLKNSLLGINGHQVITQKEFGIVYGLDEDTIARMKKLLMFIGEIETTADNRAIIPKPKRESIEKYDDEYDREFYNKTIIKDFIKFSNTKNKKSHAQALKRFCKWSRITPEGLIQIGSPNNQDSLKELRITVEPFKDHMLSLEGKINGNTKDNKGGFYAIRMGLRAFLTHNGINIPRNSKILLGFLDGRITGHGKFSDIRLTQDEIDTAKNYIKEKYGVQSDIFVTFVFGLETASRRQAILTTRLDFSRDPQKRWIKIKVFERKTEHMDEKFAKPTKFIFDSDLQDEIIRRYQLGQNYLFKDNFYTRVETNEKSNLIEIKPNVNLILTQLREVYKYLEKTEAYFSERPLHALRHISAQYHLRKSNWDYYFVAKLGNWTTIDELVKSYGEQPEEEFLKKYISIETKKESE